MDVLLMHDKPKMILFRRSIFGVEMAHQSLYGTGLLLLPILA